VPRVLITDDHEVVRRGAAEVAREALPGAEVGQAASADVALLLLAAEPWDLLVLDLDLAGRSALHLLAEVRRRWPGLPVLAMGVPAGGPEAVEALRLGAAGYAPKATPAPGLAAAMRAVTGGGRAVEAELAAAAQAARGRDAPALPLSLRERQVLRLVARGRTARQIAEELGVSTKTVATYRARLAAKLGLTTLVELTRYAHRVGLLEP